jgi:hypothetical protein
MTKDDEEGVGVEAEQPPPPPAHRTTSEVSREIFNVKVFCDDIATMVGHVAYHLFLAGEHGEHFDIRLNTPRRSSSRWLSSSTLRKRRGQSWATTTPLLSPWRHLLHRHSHHAHLRGLAVSRGTRHGTRGQKSSLW